HVVAQEPRRVLPGLADVGARGEVVEDVGPGGGDSGARRAGVQQVRSRAARDLDDVVAARTAVRGEVAAGETAGARDEGPHGPVATRCSTEPCPLEATA